MPLAGHVQVRSAGLRIGREWQAGPGPLMLEGRRSKIHTKPRMTSECHQQEGVALRCSVQGPGTSCCGSCGVSLKNSIGV